MSNKRNNKILAIDPGTKNIGFALLENDDLIHYGVKTISRLNSSQEMLKSGRKVILRLINDFQPDILAVEKTYFANNKDSILLNTFTSRINVLGKRKGLKVLSIAANTVRKSVCGNGAASKDEVARVIASRYPQLQPYLTSNRRWKERYYRNMFDAVALGLVISKDLSKK